MKSCDEFEILIERRLRGALGDDDAARLDAHLEGCSPCREYRDLATATSTGLTGAATDAQAAADWPGLERRIEGMVARYRRSVPRMAVALLVIVPLIWFAAGPEAGIGGLGLGVAILVLAALARRRIVRATLAAEEDPDDLLRLYRDEIDAAIRRSRSTILIELSMGILLIGVVIARLAGPGEHPARLLTFLAAWGAVLLVTGTWRLVAGHPRLRAERRRFAGSEE
jgi:hypothetical protein